jgi:AcrR family transcriptional regulator
LLDASLSIIAQQGFAGATTAAIASACGTAHGTVFAHFGNRAALMANIVETLGTRIIDQLAALPQGDAGLRDVLATHLAAIAPMEAVFARMVAEATQLPPEARARLFAWQSGLAARMAAAHKRDVAVGRARATDTVLLANAWIALVNHYLIHRDLFAPGGSVIARHGEALIAYFLSGVFLSSAAPNHD